MPSRRGRRESIASRFLDTTSTWKSPWKVGGNDKSPRDREATLEANLSAASINKNLINALRQGSRGVSKLHFDTIKSCPNGNIEYTEIAILQMC